MASRRFVEFGELGEAVTDGGHRHLIQGPGGFLPVAGDEGHRGTVGQEPDCGPDLLGAGVEFARNR